MGSISLGTSAVSASPHNALRAMRATANLCHKWAQGVGDTPGESENHTPHQSGGGIYNRKTALSKMLNYSLGLGPTRHTLTTSLTRHTPTWGSYPAHVCMFLTVSIQDAPKHDKSIIFIDFPFIYPYSRLSAPKGSE